MSSNISGAPVAVDSLAGKTVGELYKETLPPLYLGDAVCAVAKEAMTVVRGVLSIAYAGGELPELAIIPDKGAYVSLAPAPWCKFRASPLSEVDVSPEVAGSSFWSVTDYLNNPRPGDLLVPYRSPEPRGIHIGDVIYAPHVNEHYLFVDSFGESIRGAGVCLQFVSISTGRVCVRMLCEHMPHHQWAKVPRTSLSRVASEMGWKASEMDSAVLALPEYSRGGAPK